MGIFFVENFGLLSARLQQPDRGGWLGSTFFQNSFLVLLVVKVFYKTSEGLNIFAAEPLVYFPRVRLYQLLARRFALAMQNPGFP